jgi:hypothetical protein
LAINRRVTSHKPTSGQQRVAEQRNKRIKSKFLISFDDLGRERVALYTFIMEFMGGTYISQIKEKSLNRACRKWARTLNVREIKGLGPKSHALLIQEMKDKINQPVPLNSTQNVWCTSALMMRRWALINIVKTSVS